MESNLEMLVILILIQAKREGDLLLLKSILPWKMVRKQLE